MLERLSENIEVVHRSICVAEDVSILAWTARNEVLRIHTLEFDAVIVVISQTRAVSFTVCPFLINGERTSIDGYAFSMQHVRQVETPTFW